MSRQVTSRDGRSAAISLAAADLLAPVFTRLVPATTTTTTRSKDDMVEEGGTTPQTPSAVERPGKRRRHLSTRFSFNIGYYTYTIIQDSPG